MRVRRYFFGRASKGNRGVVGLVCAVVGVTLVVIVMTLVICFVEGGGEW